MSSQSGPSIPFTFSTNQQPFRLIELPPELAQSLKVDNPPTLFLKSSTPAIATPSAKSANGSAPSQTSTAHLVTATQSYQIRQVSTSNSVFITSPSKTLNIPQDGDQDTERPPNTTSTSLTVIGQIDSILELQPVSYVAETELLRILPVWNSPTEPIPDSIPRLSKNQLFSEIPIPDAQLESASSRLLMFRDENNTAVIPSASAALNAWKSLLETALDRSTDLASFFFPSALLSPSTSEDAPSSSTALTNLQESILHYLCTQSSSTTTTSPSPPTPWNPTEKTWLSKLQTIRWTGAILRLHLSSLSPHRPGDDDDDFSMTGTSASSPNPILISSFQNQWQSLLPSESPEWTHLATPALLQDICTTTVTGDGEEVISLIAADTSIAAAADVPVDGGPGAGAAGVGAAGVGGKPAATVDRKRKWHEKFKAQRDAANAAKKI